MPRGIDMTGKRFGRLIVIEKVEQPDYALKSRKRWWWKCKCDCGNEIILPGERLRTGNTKSCGCYGNEVRGIFSRLGFGQSAKNQVYDKYKQNARRRGISFNLSMEEFLEITQKNCFYCGCPPSNHENKPQNYGDYVYSGIDRVDNNKPYIKDNVVPCCGDCNHAKFKQTKEQFFSWVEKVYNHSIRPHSSIGLEQ
jgi:hypothetical protein